MHETHADKQQHQQRQKHFGHDFNWTVEGTNQQNVQPFELVSGGPARKNSPKTHIFLCAQLIIFARTPPFIYLIWFGHSWLWSMCHGPCKWIFTISTHMHNLVTDNDDERTADNDVRLYIVQTHALCVCVCSVKVYYAINKFVHA